MTMQIQVAAMANGDDVILTWKPTGDLAGCFGFSIERRRNGGPVEVLKNRVSDKTFQGDPTKPQELLNPSNIYPFRRVSWTDHGVDAGDTVVYRVAAMMGTLGNLKPAAASSWTDPIRLANTYGPVSVFFNRGLVISQFASRVMREHDWTPADLKKNVSLVDNRFRRFLSGQLREALLDILDKAARDPKCHVYAALFELSDDELVDRLLALGPRLHIVLANGAVKHRGDDENQSAREKLGQVHAEVIDRMCAPTFLGHNKFLVIAPANKPAQVWTGSVNWQPTGLCTQMNNGLLITNEAAANTFFAAWTRLRDAGNAHGAQLVDANSAPPVNIAMAAESSMVARFTAARDQVDLKDLLALIGQAQKSILFAMFMPGSEIFNAVMAKRQNCFVRGVANTFPTKGTKKEGQAVQDLDESQLDVTVADHRGQRDFRLAAVQPQGIPHAIGSWAAEISRQQFGAIGHAIVHSKMLVIDADGPEPYIVTGSHNFSTTASKSNDENFVVIRGNRPLAQAYAVNCLALYDHYRWRETVMQAVRAGRKPWQYGDGLGDQNWLSGYLKTHADVLNFFGLS